MTNRERVGTLMKWFKFYGQDFYTDPKVMMLTASQKLFFIGLMSLAAQEDKDNSAKGTLTLLTESIVMQYIGISPDSEGWNECKDFYGLLIELGFIKIDYDNYILTIINYNKLQKTNLSASERVTKSRKNKSKQSVSKNVNTVNKKLTLDKDIDKERDIDIISPKNNKKGSLDSLNETDFQEIASDYQTTLPHVLSCLDDLKNYCDRTGKKYKDYKAALRNFVKSSAMERRENVERTSKIEYVGEAI